MLQLAGRRGFRECAQNHISTRAIPGNVEGVGFLDSPVKNPRLSGRSGLAPETESVHPSPKCGEIGGAKSPVGPRNGAGRRHGRRQASW